MTYVVTGENEKILAKEIEIVKEAIEKNNVENEERGWEFFNDEPTDNIVNSAIRTENGLKALIFFRERPLVRFGLTRTR